MSAPALSPARRAGRPRIQPLNLIVPAGWGACPTCAPEDCIWPIEAFRAWEQAGDGYRTKTPICGACLFERYPKVHKACSTCGSRIAYHPARAHVRYPQCRSCVRAALPTCGRCKEPTGGRMVVGGLCVGCHLATSPVAEALDWVDDRHAWTPGWVAALYELRRAS